MRPARQLSDDLDRVCRRLRGAGHVLVALDYDGTLAPIAPTPDAASIPPETASALHALAASDRYSLAIVSGRALADLRRRVNVPAIYSGNHGLEIEGAGISFVHECAEFARSVIGEACRRLEHRFESVPAVVVERKGIGATVHYRRAPSEIVAWIRATVEGIVQPFASVLRVLPALQALEIRPRLHWNKGSAVRLLLGAMRTASPALVCAGDDSSDEDMFGILPGEVSIKVGPAGRTRASYRVRGPAELAWFLKTLAGSGGYRVIRGSAGRTRGISRPSRTA